MKEKFQENVVNNQIQLQTKARGTKVMGTKLSVNWPGKVMPNLSFEVCLGAPKIQWRRTIHQERTE